MNTQGAWECRHGVHSSDTCWKCFAPAEEEGTYDWLKVGVHTAALACSLLVWIGLLVLLVAVAELVF